MLLREGRPDLSVCDSLEKGVITLYNRIISRVSSDFDMLLEDTDIDTIILGKNSDYSDSVIRLVKQMTKQYGKAISSKEAMMLLGLKKDSFYRLVKKWEQNQGNDE